jgi:hypothetical protein
VVAVALGGFSHRRFFQGEEKVAAARWGREDARVRAELVA